jgi:hypothetical protein
VLVSRKSETKQKREKGKNTHMYECIDINSRWLEMNSKPCYLNKA